MKITVNKQTHRFFLALEKWEPVVGHEIKVGDYRFCAIPLKEVINISEVTSGCKVLNIPISFEIMMVTASKEQSLKYLEKVGKQLEKFIEKTSDFDKHLEKMKNIAFDRLGEMPPIENVDTEWVFEDGSELLN